MLIQPDTFYSARAMLMALSLFISSLVVLGQPAHAQGVFDMGVLTNTVSQGALTNSERERVQQGKHTSSFSKKRITTSRSTRAVFTPSATVRKHNIDTFLNRIRATDPQNAEQMKKPFTSKDIFGTMNQKLSEYGMQTNSVTDAVTAYLVSTLQAVHGDTSNPSKSHVQGVRKQMGQALSGIPALTSASDAAKQERADGLLLQAMLIDSYVEGAKSHPEIMHKIKSSVATGARANLRFDLALLKMKTKGYIGESVAESMCHHGDGPEAQGLQTHDTVSLYPVH